MNECGANCVIAALQKRHYTRISADYQRKFAGRKDLPTELADYRGSARGAATFSATANTFFPRTRDSTTSSTRLAGTR